MSSRRLAPKTRLPARQQALALQPATTTAMVTYGRAAVVAALARLLLDVARAGALKEAADDAP